MFIRQNYSKCRLKWKQKSYLDLETKPFCNYLMEFIWLDLIKPVFTPSIMIILIILKFWKSKHNSQQHWKKIQKCLFCPEFVWSKIPISFAGASFWVSLVLLKGTNIIIIIIIEIIIVELQTNHIAASFAKVYSSLIRNRIYKFLLENN